MLYNLEYKFGFNLNKDDLGANMNNKIKAVLNLIQLINNNNSIEINLFEFIYSLLE